MILLTWRNKNSSEVMTLEVTSDIADALIAEHRGEWDMFYCQGTFVPA